MKSIILSVSPQEALNILNGKATMLLRKRIPKGFVGWCYLYVGKGRPYLYKGAYKPMHSLDKTNPLNYHWNLNNKLFNIDLQNGKVIARFWWDESEEIQYGFTGCPFPIIDDDPNFIISKDILKKLCLTTNEIDEYGGAENEIVNNLFAIHIKQLEIFDKPKSLGEFRYFKKDGCKLCVKETKQYGDIYFCDICKPNNITNAPKNYVFVELNKC